MVCTRLYKQGIKGISARPSQDALLKSLDLEWSDHRHMRDQSWKSLNFCIVLFGGIVTAFASESLGDYVIPLCVVSALFALCGRFVAAHHADKQRLKFDAIKNIERALGLGDVLKPAMSYDSKSTVAFFIVRMHSAMFLGSLAMAGAYFLRGIIK
jgi:hypothetical protein